VAIEVSENTWNLLGIALPMLHFQANLLFPCEHSARANGRYTSRNFSYMVTTSWMSVVVSNIGGEWLVGRNVLCNVSMACYRCFFIYVSNHNHHHFTRKVEGFTFRVSGL